MRFRREPGLGRQKEQSTVADWREPTERSGILGVADFVRPGLHGLTGADERGNWAEQLQQRAPR